MKALHLYGQEAASAEFAAARDRALEQYELELNEMLLNREIGLQDHDLARQAFMDQLALEDRARGQYYEDLSYRDSRLDREQQLYLSLVGLGTNATTTALRNSLMIGGDWARAQAYGVEGWGLSRFAAYSEGLSRANQEGSTFGTILQLLGDLWGDAEV